LHIFGIVKRKIFVIAAAVLMTGISLFFALQLKFEEDISKIIPAEKKFSSISTIYSNSKIAERLAVNITLSNFSAPENSERLIEYANDFVRELENKNLSTLIKEINYKVDDNFLDEAVSVFYNNLPLFLSPKDYKLIDTLIAKKNIKKSIENNYKVLISPASMVLKKYIVRDPLGITYIILNKLRNSQFTDEYLISDGYIFTSDKKNLLMFISCVNPSSQTALNSILIDSLESTISKLKTKYNNQITVDYFGGAAIAASNASRIKQDITLTVILSIVLLIVFISYFVKVRWAAFLTFLPAVFGGLVSLAVLYFIKGKVSSISLGLGSILLGVGVDYALYIFSYIKKESDKYGAVRLLAFPIAICALTSIAVFYCLMYVQTEALRDLGLFMAISLLGAAFFSIAFLPYFISIYKKKDGLIYNQDQSKFIQWIFNYRFDKNKPLIIVIILASCVFFFTSKWVDFDSDLQKMNYMDSKLKAAETKFNSITNFSLKSIYIVSSGKSLDDALQLNDSVFLIIEELKEKSIVKGSSSISNFLSSNINQQKKIQYWNEYWTQNKKKLLKNMLIKEGALYNFNSSAFNEFFSILDKKYSNLDSGSQKKLTDLLLSNFIVDNDQSKMIINLLKVDNQDKEKIYSAFASIDNVTIGDRQYLANYLIKILKDDFNFLVDISSLVILIILILALGRIELGVIAFLPIKLSWMWTVGLMGVFGAKFTIFNIIISTLIFSTGVDYCILIMQSLQQDYAYGRKILPINKYGIFLSSSTTIIGVGVLIFAVHPALKSVALLPIVGYLSVVLMTFTIEPILVSWLMLKKKERGVYPVTLLTLIYTIFAYTYFLSGCLTLTSVGFIIAKLPIASAKKRKRFLHVCMQYFCKSMIYIMVNVKKKVINENNERFEKPAIIVCNHQSVLDILLSLMLSPKFILLTNDWVWNSHFFGKIVQYAQFYPVSSGIEESIPKLEEKVKEGFSIVVFAEGSRSSDSRVHRFHKGAFYIAEKLNLDILPIIFHGTGDTIKKGELWVRNGSLTVKILPRIKPNNYNYGSAYSEKTKLICKYFRKEFDVVKREKETPAYFKDKLIKNYIYKEVVLEWYLRIKLKLENNYSQIIERVPLTATVTDIGCGYGFLSYMLNMTSSYRNIIGIDHDKNKIAIANNCFSKNTNINFVEKNIMEIDLPKSGVFILFDVLHYLKYAEQEILLNNCVNNLDDGGLIIIRDANRNLQSNHLLTRLTEYLSIGLKFNKNKNENLYFISEDFILNTAKKNNLDVQIRSKAKYTSNQMFILKKRVPVVNSNHHDVS